MRRQLVWPLSTLVILGLLVVVAPALAISQVELEMFSDLLSGNNVVCQNYRQPGVFRGPCVGLQSGGGQHDGFFTEIRQNRTFQQNGKDVLSVTVNQNRLVAGLQIFIENLPVAQQTTIAATQNSIRQLLQLQNIPQVQVNALRSRVYGITKALSAPSGTSTVIMTGLEAPGGSRIYTNRDQALQSEIRGAERAAGEAVRFAITGGKVGVQATSQPIAVLPPGIFGQPAGEAGYRAIGPETFLEKIRTFLLELSIPAFILLVVLGGLFMILAPFSKGYIDLGKKYIYWAVIGYVVLLVASAAIALLRGLFGGR